jgi:preprotein translocase subunit Sec63
MAGRNKLNKKQLAVMEDLFSGELDERAVLEKHRISGNVYRRWLADGLFASEFDHRITSAHRQSAAIIAKYAPLAAAKLVQLTESDKEETARKACLDIISLPALLDKKMAQPSETQTAESQQQQQITERTAGRLLAALAREEQ